VGKLFARFSIETLEAGALKDPKRRKDLVNQLRRDLRKNIQQCSIKVCLVSIRGLSQPAYQPRLEVSLTDSILDNKRQNDDEDDQADNERNPVIDLN